MECKIYQPKQNAKRIKFYVPFQAVSCRKMVKELNTSFFHYDQKLWSIVNTRENLNLLKKVLGAEVEICNPDTPTTMPHVPLNEAGKEAVGQLEAKLILKGYSPHTINNYRSALIPFLTYFTQRDLNQVTKEEIEGYVYHIKNKYRISDSKQNMVINAIKFYYEQILGQKREYYDIQRPKKALSLPNVLSLDEVKRLLDSPKNLKHRALLYTIYGAGLRLNELLQLRIEDVHSDDGYLFIKAGKGKKDRKTLLSPILLEKLRAYYRKYKPAYWLFEGQSGEKYSSSSVAKVFRKAQKESGINPWATLHTLRHSFATHLLQKGTNLRYIQTLLGHQSSKTTEIYTHVMNVSSKTIESPLDLIFKSPNLQ